jgi:Na+-driven multidrug efflux pump
MIPETIAGWLSGVNGVIAATAEVLRLLAPGLPVIACALIFTQSLFGAGCTKFVMFVEAGLHFTCLIPLSYLIGIVLGWGVLGMWGAVLVYASALCIIMFCKLRAGGWKKVIL